MLVIYWPLYISFVIKTSDMTLLIIMLLVKRSLCVYVELHYLIVSYMSLYIMPLYNLWIISHYKY